MIRRLQAQGFRLRGCKMIQLNDDVLKEHYAHIASKPFFPEVANFMRRNQPVIAIALAGDDVIAKVRDLLGPTDSKAAAKGTIRGDFGEQDGEHGSRFGLARSRRRRAQALLQRRRAVQPVIDAGLPSAYAARLSPHGTATQNQEADEQNEWIQTIHSLLHHPAKDFLVRAHNAVQRSGRGVTRRRITDDVVGSAVITATVK